LNVHVLDCGLDDPDELRDVVLEATLSPIDVRMHRMPEDVLERFHLNRPNLSKAAFARLLAPSILADVDRVLYLDSDVLVTGDIVELWRCDLGGLARGAVRDPLFVFLGQDVRNCRQFGISPLHHYFGTGVMLMDLRQWRNEDVEPRLLELGAPSRLVRRFNDQSILNLHFAGRIRPLPRRWNQLRFHWNGSALHLPRTRGIVHVGGASKAWHFAADGAVGVNRLHHDTLRGVAIPAHWIPEDLETNPRRSTLTALRAAKLALRSSPLGVLWGLPFVARTFLSGQPRNTALPHPVREQSKPLSPRS